MALVEDTSREHTSTAAAHPERVAAPVGAHQAAETLKNGPIGAYIVASLAVGILFLAWLAFCFFLFIPRGAVG